MHRWNFKNQNLEQQMIQTINKLILWKSVGCLVWFYTVSIFFGSFNTKLSQFDKSFKQLQGGYDKFPDFFCMGI